jgi:hypothetical protein
MERAYLKSATAKEWFISFSDPFAMDSVQRSLSFLQETIDRLAGQRILLRFLVEARQAREADPVIVVAPAEEAKIAEASKDANVQKILSMFKGKIRLPDEPSE